MRVVKVSGELQNFNAKKIYNSIREAGGSSKLAKGAIKEIRKKLYPNIPTSEILEIILNYLKVEPGVSERYDLKRAVMSLGPSGFPFEDFFARVLEYYGYCAKTGNKLKGKFIFHEVDVIAEKNFKKWMVECKYHNEGGIITRLHPAMYTYARFLDLNKYNFCGSWLVTNTKCSEDAIKYSKGVNQKITSWNYPSGESLLELIENKKIYPITILKDLSKSVLEKLYSLKLVVANDLLEKDIHWLMKNTNLSEKNVKSILEELKIILN